MAKQYLFNKWYRFSLFLKMRELEKRKILQRLSQNEGQGPEMKILNEQSSSRFSSHDTPVPFG